MESLSYDTQSVEQMPAEVSTMARDETRRAIRIPGVVES